MTDQKTNEAVAERLGLKFKMFQGFYAVGDYSETKLFEPATDPAAALWALEQFAASKGAFETYAAGTTLIRDSKGVWSCMVSPMHEGQGTFCQAICAAILKE